MKPYFAGGEKGKVMAIFRARLDFIQQVNDQMASATGPQKFVVPHSLHLAKGDLDAIFPAHNPQLDGNELTLTPGMQSDSEEHNFILGLS